MNNVTAMPGVQPRRVVNESAADELQAVVDRLRAGEFVGVAWVGIRSNGKITTGWNTPTGMAERVFIGLSSMSYQMMKDMNDG